MLDSLTAATFAPHAGEIFRMYVDDSTTLDARLTEVTESKWASSPEKRRTPFSLYFQTGEHEVLPQRIYRLHHAALGELEIFLVPTTRNGEGVLYEAVFN